MKITIRCLILLMAVFFALGCANNSSSEPKKLLLQNVNIVDTANARIIPRQQVLMENGRISEMGSVVEVPAGSTYDVINGANGYVTPGLIDMHVHVYDQSALALALSHGVVHQRVMNGMPQILDWRDDVATGKFWGSSLTVSSPIVTGIPDEPLRVYAGTPEQGAQAVYDAYEAGYDLIKVYNTLGAETFAALIYQANDLDIPLALHGPHPPPGMTWQELQTLQSLEHVEDIFQGPLNFQQDQQKLNETIQIYKELDVTISATLAVFQQLTRISAEKQAFIDTLPQEYISPIIRYYEKQTQVQRWLQSEQDRADYNVREMAYLLEITRQLHAQGIELVLGSDAGVLLLPIGLGTHNELALLTQAGLSAFEALQTGTVNAARALKKSTELGQINTGFRADFIYTRKNPIEGLETLRYPDALVTGGIWHDKRDLEAKRQQAIDERSFWQELWLLVSNY